MPSIRIPESLLSKKHKTPCRELSIFLAERQGFEPCYLASRGSFIHQKTAHDEQYLCINMAERQGFEPWVPCGTAVFKTAAFNHSAISPSG